MVPQIIRTNGLVDVKETAPVALMNNYLIHWARNPDPGSWFDWMTIWRHWVSDRVLLHLLFRLRYGCQLLLENENVVSHIFHQQHGDELHLFSIFTIEPRQNEGIAKRMLREWLIEAWNTPGINKVRISAGNDKAVAHMYERVLEGAYDLPFEMTRGKGPGWVKLIR